MCSFFHLYIQNLCFVFLHINPFIIIHLLYQEGYICYETESKVFTKIWQTLLVLFKQLTVLFVSMFLIRTFFVLMLLCLMPCSSKWTMALMTSMAIVRMVSGSKARGGASRRKCSSVPSGTGPSKQINLLKNNTRSVNVGV